MNELARFDYRGQELRLMETAYVADNRPALAIVTELGEPYCTLSVYLEYERPKEGEFHIKAWSENEDIANFLRDSNFFEDTGKRVKTGFVEAEVWKILI